MLLPPQAIREFQQIWREEYGEDISFEDARPIAERFLWCIREMMVIREPKKGLETPTPE